MTKLKSIFTELANRYTSNTGLVEQLWQEIEKNYTSPKRHYHNLTHLENLYHQLAEVKILLQDWDTVLFALFYHDVVYNVLKQNNEDKSAELAVERLHEIAYPADKMQVCSDTIFATKRHEASDNNDTNFFTDADLSILGADWETYNSYCKQIRREYSIYPDLLYKPGRKKVLQHFLAMDRIYKTDVFYKRYEKQAKENMERELKMLVGG